MLHKTSITQNDRLLAAGLMSFIVLFLLLGPIDTQGFRVLMIIGFFASGAVAFSISPLLHGSPIQRAIAGLVLLPAVAYFVVVFLAIGSGRLGG